MKLLLACVLACCVWGTASAEPTPDKNKIEKIRYVIAQQLQKNPNDRLARFHYAQASYQSGHPEIAKYHLTVLMRSSKNAKELAQLQKAYAEVTKSSPWSVGLNFSLLPSTNIGKSSSNEFFDTALGQFTIVGGADEQSGLGLRFGAGLNYATALPNGVSLTYGLAINRSQYPTERLNSFDGTLSLTFSQHTLGGYTKLTPYITRYVYDVDPGTNSDSMRYGLQFSHEFIFSPKHSITGALSIEHQNYKNLDYLDGAFVNASLSYRTIFAQRNALNLKFGLSKRTPQQEHLRYNGVSVAAEVTRRINNIGTFGVNLGVDLRQYDGIFPALDFARSDSIARIGLSFTTPRIQIFDSSPKLSCQVEQNWSNVDLYDYRSTDCSITFERRF